MQIISDATGRRWKRFQEQDGLGQVEDAARSARASQQLRFSP